MMNDDMDGSFSRTSTPGGALAKSGVNGIWIMVIEWWFMVCLMVEWLDGVVMIVTEIWRSARIRAR